MIWLDPMALKYGASPSAETHNGEPQDKATPHFEACSTEHLAGSLGADDCRRSAGGAGRPCTIWCRARYGRVGCWTLTLRNSSAARSGRIEL
jgi:hypothetical protein